MRIGIRLIVMLAILGMATTSGAFDWTPKADTSGGAIGFGRSYHGGGTINNRIYIAGGGFVGASLWGSDETGEVHDPLLDSWRPIASMSNRRTGVGAAVAWSGTNERLYVVGGLDLTDFPVGHVSIPSIEAYDPDTDSWSIVGDCSVAANCLPDPTSTWGAGVVSVDGLLYIMGGTDESFGTLSDRLASYDPLTDTFQALQPMPSGSSDGVCVAIGRKIYWVSGYSNARGWGAPPSSGLFIYDIDTDSWSISSVGVPTARANAAGIGIDDTIFVVGGWDGSAAYAGMYDHVEAYDTLTDSWMAPVPNALDCPGDDGASIRGRSGLTLHVANDGTSNLLFAVGGAVGVSIPTRCNESSPPPGPGDTDPPVFAGIETAAEDLACADPTAPAVLLGWSAASDASLPVTYSVYRGTTPVFVPDAMTLIASGLTDLGYRDALSELDCGSTYFYLVRAQDAAAPPNTDANDVRLAVDITCPSAALPGDVGPALRVTKTGLSEPALDWSLATPSPDTTHYKVYRSTRADALGSLLYEPLTTDQIDAFASGALYFYDVRAANDCPNGESLD